MLLGCYRRYSIAGAEGLLPNLELTFHLVALRNILVVFQRQQLYKTAVQHRHSLHGAHPSVPVCAGGGCLDAFTSLRDLSRRGCFRDSIMVYGDV